MQDRFVMFTTLIGNISRSIFRMKSELMSEFDLKSSHVSCLYYLHHGMAKSSAELCRVCDEDKANISRAVKELEERGMIVRQRDSRGRRSGRLAITDDGREIAIFITEQIDNILDVLDDVATDDERNAMYKALTGISNRLSALCADT